MGTRMCTRVEFLEKDKDGYLNAIYGTVIEYIPGDSIQLPRILCTLEFSNGISSICRPVNQFFENNGMLTCYL